MISNTVSQVNSVFLFRKNSAGIFQSLSKKYPSFECAARARFLTFSRLTSNVLRVAKQQAI